MIGLIIHIKNGVNMEKIVIGIDVSKDKLDYSIYNGSSYSNGYIENEIRTIKLFLGKQKTHKDLHVIMEATGTYHLKLVSCLQGKRINFSVVNPLIIKRYSGSKMLRAKTDSVDARLISIYGYEQNPPLFRPRSKHQVKLISLLKAIEDLVQNKNSIENRLEALFQSPDDVRIIENTFKQVIRILEQKITKLEQEALEIATTCYKDAFRRLLSIKSVGEKTALVILAFFGCFEEFESSKQVVSYIGSNPAPHESGRSVLGRGRISKKGNAYLRKQLFMTSLSAIQHNRACKELYHRLRANGKEHKVARIATMNKLVRQIFAVMKYQREYDPNYQFYA